MIHLARPFFDRRHAAPLLTMLVLVATLPWLAGCQEPMPIPRIEPHLHSWRQPYQGVDGLKVHVFNTGTMAIPRAAVFAGGSWGDMEELDILAFVIEHPVAGLVVFDTGFNPLAHYNPHGYLGRLIADLQLVDMEEGQDLPGLMRAEGLEPDDVTMVVVSHLHFDHTGTIEAFTNATVVVSKRELQEAGRGLLEGFAFIGEDYDGVVDWREIDYESGEPYATFIAHEDLLGDGSLVAVSLEGHTAGSQGLIVRTADAPILLAGDAASVEESWRYAARPLVAYDMRLWWEQIWRIKKFSRLEPRLVVLPGHDSAALERFELAALVNHEPPRPQDVNEPREEGGQTR